MKQSAYKSFDDLPLYLNADMIADLLGISHAGTYELMHEKDFPVLRIGSRMVVPREDFKKWSEAHTGGVRN